VGWYAGNPWMDGKEVEAAHRKAHAGAGKRVARHAKGNAGGQQKNEKFGAKHGLILYRRRSRRRTPYGEPGKRQKPDDLALAAANV
jgi:hypothetical protein